MENKLLNVSFKGYFITVAVLMYYFLEESFNLGLFVTYRHVFALVLVISTVFAFLLKPNIARGAASLKSALVYCTPLIVIVLISLFIWFTKQVDTVVIARGLSAVFIYTNMFSFTFAAVAFLYVFGEKGIWYNLIAILISNFFIIFTVISQNGIGPFISEFSTLVFSFAGQTGDVIVQAEVHELAFCLGAYIIYMCLKPKKNFVFWLMFGLSLICFLTSFKRIGIIAIVVAIVVGLFLRLIAKLNLNTAKNSAIIISVFTVILLIGYIAIIKMDVFTLLEKAGIDTSGRVEIYDSVDKFYDFSLEFLGNGIGFLTYQLSNNVNIGVSAVHNDFLQYFIDLGFVGYILWLVSMTVVRVCYFGRKKRIDNAIITLALTVYLVIVSTTDNTMNYPLLTMVLAVIMIGHGFDDDVRDKEMKMFGYVSDVNNQAKEESLL